MNCWYRKKKKRTLFVQITESTCFCAVLGRPWHIWGFACPGAILLTVHNDVITRFFWQEISLVYFFLRYRKTVQLTSQLVYQNVTSTFACYYHNVTHDETLSLSLSYKDKLHIYYRIHNMLHSLDTPIAGRGPHKRPVCTHDSPEERLHMRHHDSYELKKSINMCL